MADRYWVGGTATWDGTAGTKWAATSGGAGGESVPGLNDDVFFDANSSGTVTIGTSRNARAVNCTGFTGTLAGTAAINVYGDVTLVSGMGFTHSGSWQFLGSAAITFISAGKNPGISLQSSFTGSVTLGDALTTTRQITVSGGTFDTAGYALTLTSTLRTFGTTAKTINLGASAVVFSSSGTFAFTEDTNLTFNAGTSEVTLNSAVSLSTTLGQTFYNVTCNANVNINGSNTFNDLTRAATATGRSFLNFSASQTINGTLTCAGSSYTQRGVLRSSERESAVTLTCNAVNLSDCDFEDITFAGNCISGGDISGTRFGDCGGNTAIAFDAPKTVYRVGTDTTWQGSDSWALTSGGTGSDANRPLVHDTAVVDDNTALTGTLGSANLNYGSLDCSARTNSITVAFNTLRTWFGDLILSTATAVTGTTLQTFSPRTTRTLNMAGRSLASMTVNGNGTLKLDSAVTITGFSGINFDSGTFDANNYSVTTTIFQSTASTPRNLVMGSGFWTITDAGIFAWFLDPSVTVDKGTADILLSNTTTSDRSFTGGGQEYNRLTIGGATGTSTLTINGANTFSELASTKTVAHTVRLGGDQTVGVWSISGSSGNVVTLQSSSATITRTLDLQTATASNIDYLAVSRMSVPTADRFFVGSNSTDGGNNTNVYFFPAPAASVDLDADGTLTLTGSATATGAGQLTAATSATLTAAATLDAAGALNAAGMLAAAASATVEGLGSLAASAALTATGNATATATGALTAAAAVSLTGSATLDAEIASDLASTAAISLTGSAALNAPGALAAADSVSLTAAADLSGALNATAAGSLVLTSAASLTAPGALLAADTLALNGAAHVVGRGVLAAEGNVVLVSFASLSGLRPNLTPAGGLLSIRREARTLRVARR